MKFQLVALFLVASVMVNGGNALKCYQCSSNSNNTVCNGAGPTSCTDTASDTCQTTLAYVGSRYNVAKLCVSKSVCDYVKKTDLSTSALTVLTTCCQTDGCNVNGAPRLLGAGHAALALLGLGVSVASRALM